MKDCPHVPIHKLGLDGVFIVTSATLHKESIFNGSEKLSMLESELLTLTKEYYWQLEAWANFSNHYHIIIRNLPGARELKKLLKHLHANSARKANQLDQLQGRKVWYNYWDTRLTYERSYLARLNYVHQNPVKHGLVPVANQYPWCSAAWFERTASLVTVETIYGLKIDELQINDDY